MTLQKNTKITLNTTNKILPILFAVAMVGMLSFPAHAQTTTTGTAGVTGSLLVSVNIDPFEPGAETITINVVLADGIIDDTVDPRIGAQVTVLDTVGNPNNAVETQVTIGDNHVEGTNILRTTVNVNDTTPPLDTSTGSNIQTVVIAFTTDGVASPSLGQVFVQQAGEIQVLCGYQDTPDLDYGTLARGESATQAFLPSITDTIRYNQPTEVGFHIGAFKLGDVDVVDAIHTSINRTAGPEVQFASVNADDRFEFETVLNFVDSNAYISSVGQTITQTTMITPICEASQ